MRRYASPETDLFGMRVVNNKSRARFTSEPARRGKQRRKSKSVLRLGEETESKRVLRIRAMSRRKGAILCLLLASASHLIAQTAVSAFAHRRTNADRAPVDGESAESRLHPLTPTMRNAAPPAGGPRSAARWAARRRWRRRPPSRRRRPRTPSCPARPTGRSGRPCRWPRTAAAAR